VSTIRNVHIRSARILFHFFGTNFSEALQLCFSKDDKLSNEPQFLPKRKGFGNSSDKFREHYFSNRKT
jgi:hypothetical protein